jgi:hypothetical protein
MSSGGGEISELSSTQKRTSAWLNIAQVIAQDRGNIANKSLSQPNTAQAVSKGVENDSKYA